MGTMASVHETWWRFGGASVHAGASVGLYVGLMYAQVYIFFVGTLQLFTVDEIHARIEEIYIE